MAPFNGDRARTDPDVAGAGSDMAGNDAQGAYKAAGSYVAAGQALSDEDKDEDEGGDGADVLDQTLLDGSHGDALFDGDAGDLPIATRRALTALLSRPYISSIGERDIFATVQQEQAVLSRELSNLGLKLHLSERYEVAWAVQAPIEGVNPLRRLKRTYPLPRDATLLLVSIRVQQHADEARGQDIWFIDYEDMANLLASGPYADDRDGKRVASAINAAVDRLEKLGYIRKVNEAEGRYRVMPIVPATFSLERAKECLAALQAQAPSGDDGLTGEEGEQSAVGEQGEDDEY